MDELDHSSDLASQLRIDAIAERYEHERRKPDVVVTLHPFLAEVIGDEQGQLLQELVRIDLEISEARQSFQDYVAEFPVWRAEIRRAFQLANQTTVSEGDVLNGYRILELCGSGGDAFVYKCIGDNNRPLALKLPRHKSEQRCHREAELIESLDHVGIVKLIDFGVSAEHGPYIVMPFYRDGTLANIIDTQLDYQAVTNISVSILRALKYAHQKGVYHRDLKPSNILLDRTRAPIQVLLADFGLAVSDDETKDHDEVAGSLRYMAPEQLRGSQWQDGRCDIWSFGVVLYQMLTGRLPFRQSNDNDAIDEILFRDPRPPRQIRPDIPRQLEQICLRCLEKDPGSRYVTTADVLADFRSLQRNRWRMRCARATVMLVIAVATIVPTWKWLSSPVEPSIATVKTNFTNNRSRPATVSDEVRLPCIGDAWLGCEPINQNGNTGGADVLHLGITDSPTMTTKVIVKFQIPPEPIQFATLRLFVSGIYDEGGPPHPIQLDVYPISEPWDEGREVDIFSDAAVDVTWNQRKTGVPWPAGGKLFGI